MHPLGSQVPNPNNVSKSQHEGKVPTFEPNKLLNYALYSLKVDFLFFYANSLGIVLRIGSSFLLDPTLNTSPKPRLQKMLPSRHQCHTWDLGFGTMSQIVSPNFHDLNG